MATQKVEVISTKGKTVVLIGGHKIENIRSISLKQDAGDIPVLTVDLNALNLSIDADAILMQKGYGEINMTFKEMLGEE